jgi:hypothetical protein
MRFLLSLFLLFLNPLNGADYIINWGTDAGPNSPNYDDLSASPWTNNPSPVQLLKDFSGAALIDTTGGPDSSWSKGDLIELGFFADLGDDDALGGSGSNADSASTTLFSGSWVPITSETYIGQDWGDGSPSWETVAAGEFAFLTQFTNNGSWNTSAVSNEPAETAYEIQSGDDTPTNLTTALALLSSGNTPLGMRFYDSTAKTDGVTSYNTIMNSNWTWPSAGSILDMTIHTDTSSANNLDSNLRFEFDNTNHGTNNGTSSVFARKTTSDTAVSTTAVPGTATNPTADDFVTTITYISDTHLNSNNLDLSDSGGKGSMVISGLTNTSTSNYIDGGSGTNEEHQLTIHAASSSSAFSFAGGIHASAGSGSSTDLAVLKTGAGTQTLTGAINLADAASDGTTSGFIYLSEGTLELKPNSGGIQKVEYVEGQSGATLKLDSTGAGSTGKVIELGFGNTSSAKTFAGGLNLAGNTSGVTLDVGGGTNFGAHQIISGAITEDASSNFVLRKTGSGKLSLNGDSSADFAGGVTIADGGGTKDGGILVAGHNNALGTGTTTIEHGKLSIGAGVTVTNLIRGEQTSNDTDKKSVIGGGIIGAAGIINNSTQIDIGSATGEIDVLSPGMAHASSMSNGTSDYQVIAGNHDNTGSDSLNLSIGTIQIDKIGLKNGGVFDWEITDFAGDNSGGSDWDVLKFDTLNFDATNDTFDINIYSLASDGSAGGVTVDGSNHLYSSKTGTSGFKFMEWTGSGTPNGTTEGWLGDQTAREVTAFNINSDSWAYHNNFYYGDWSVWYESGSFYLQYSAVPEPSTYFMVTGLLMLPGYNFLRRIRKKKSLGDVEDITDNA